MSFQAQNTVAGRSEYFTLTRTATYSYLAALPLFLAYEILILVVNGGGTAQIRVGADVWIKQAMNAMGAPGLFSVGVLVILIGTGVYLSERKKNVPVYGQYFLLMIAESFMYAVVVAFIVSYIVGIVFAAGIVPTGLESQVSQGPGMAEMLVLSIGAGLYEELVFRVLLVGGLYWGIQHLASDKITAYLVAAVVGALVFSAVHYMGALGDPFELPSFVFRFLFGLALNALFLVRGFGVAAWTHALYDILVVSQILG